MTYTVAKCDEVAKIIRSVATDVRSGKLRPGKLSLKDHKTGAPCCVLGHTFSRLSTLEEAGFTYVERLLIPCGAKIYKISYADRKALDSALTSVAECNDSHLALPDSIADRLSKVADIVQALPHNAK